MATQTTLRRRVTSLKNHIKDSLGFDDLEKIDTESRFAKGLTAPDLLKASPQHSGQVLKFHVSLIFTMLPAVLQKIIQRCDWLSWARPTWTPRYLILCGSYLYRFVDTANGNKGPKGSPILIQSVTVSLLSSTDQAASDAGIALAYLPPGYKCVILIDSLRKRHYYACRNREEGLTWINSLNETKLEATKRSMGHVPKDSYSKSWEYYDTLGRGLYNSKERIRDRMERGSLREMEMNMYTEGGPIPRAYFG
jgi:hypothetical protein